MGCCLSEGKNYTLQNEPERKALVTLARRTDSAGAPLVGTLTHDVPVELVAILGLPIKANDKEPTSIGLAQGAPRLGRP